MRAFALLIGFLATTAAAAAPVDSSEYAKTCDALGEWTPIHLPAANAEMDVPCSEADIKAYADANTLNSTQGMVGSECGGLTYHVIYAINTPEGFFDRFVAAAPSGEGRFDLAGHRAFRSVSPPNGAGIDAQQIVEIDSKRALIMDVTAEAGSYSNFKTAAGCFFNTFRFAQS